MNFKKIIPLGVAALSVAAALSACSDDKVSGADIQDNSMAQGSSSSVVPGSSNTVDIEVWAKNAALALVRANSGSAKAVSRLAGEPLPGGIDINYRYDFPIDSVNAHETFNNAVQSIYDAGGVVFPLHEDSVAQNFPNCKIANFTKLSEEAKRNLPQEDYEACVAVDEYILNHVLNNETFVVMKDEEGLLHGPIVSETQYAGFPQSLRNVFCLDNEGLFGYYVGHVTEDSNHHKYLRTIDSVMVEEFKKDCATENGEFTDWHEESLYHVYCGFQYTLTPDSILTYSDPYWEKYAKHVVEGCVHTENDYYGGYLDYYNDYLE